MVFATFGHGHFAFCMVFATFGHVSLSCGLVFVIFLHFNLWCAWYLLHCFKRSCGRFSGNKWSSSTKIMLDLAFYKVTPLFFLMPRIRLFKMLFHLIYLKTSALYKMLVGKYRFQKDVCSLQSGGEHGQFYLHFEARKRHCTGGQPTPKGRGNLNPHQNIPIGLKMALEVPNPQVCLCRLTWGTAIWPLEY